MKQKLATLTKGYFYGLISRPVFIASLISLFSENQYLNKGAMITTLISIYFYTKYFNLTKSIKNANTLQDFKDELLILGVAEKDLTKYLRKL